MMKPSTQWSEVQHTTCLSESMMCCNIHYVSLYLCRSQLWCTVLSGSITWSVAYSPDGDGMQWQSITWGSAIDGVPVGWISD